MDKLASIVTPCYNGEKYLGSFFESILSQTYDKIEIILVDDGSIDSTKQISEKYKNAFTQKGYLYKYIYQNNRGQAGAINTGLKHVNGEFMMWMDSDDILLPDAIEKKVTFLEEHPDLGFVLCQGEIVQDSNLFEQKGILQRKHTEGVDNLFEDLLHTRNVVFAPGSIMVRMAAFDAVIDNREIYESREGQNWQLMLPLAYSCKWGYIDEILFKYVIHEDSHSHQTRTYKQWMKRYEGFRVLQEQTINRILDMPSIEKKYWMKQIAVICWKSQLELSLKEHAILNQFILCIKLLISGIRIERDINPIIYYYRKIKYRLTIVER